RRFSRSARSPVRPGSDRERTPVGEAAELLGHGRRTRFEQHDLTRASPAAHGALADEQPQRLAHGSRRHMVVGGERGFGFEQLADLPATGPDRLPDLLGDLLIASSGRRCPRAGHRIRPLTAAPLPHMLHDSHCLPLCLPYATSPPARPRTGVAVSHFTGELFINFSTSLVI